MAISYNSLTTVTTKTRYVVTLTSGTSWTVPTGCTNVNATLIGGGGGGTPSTQTGSGNTLWAVGSMGMPGQQITTNFATTPGASITYAIGAGGGNQAAGGTTTMTGATSAAGGTAQPSGGAGAGVQAAGLMNGGGAGQAGTSFSNNGGTGGAGQIIIEYWA